MRLVTFDAALVEKNLPMAMWFVKKRFYSRDASTLDDLQQAAALGLIKAAQVYDPSRGTKFATVAHFKMQGATGHARRSIAGPLSARAALRRLRLESECVAIDTDDALSPIGSAHRDDASAYEVTDESVDRVRARIRAALVVRFGDRRADMLVRRVCRNETFREIATVHRVSRECVRQIMLTTEDEARQIVELEVKREINLEDAIA